MFCVDDYDISSTLISYKGVTVWKIKTTTCASNNIWTLIITHNGKQIEDSRLKITAVSPIHELEKNDNQCYTQQSHTLCQFFSCISKYVHY